MSEPPRLALEQRQTLFPVPLLVFRLDGAADLNHRLEAEIRARMEAESAIAPRSNRGGWHSSSDLFERAEPAHRALAAAIGEALGEATSAAVPGIDWGRVEMIREGWVNVSKAGDYHTPHDHPGAFWSGVYYVRVPEVAGEGGEIEFLSGRGGNPQAALMPAPMSWDYLRIRPEAGAALIFPGHVRHWVTPARGSGERISVAFNAAFRARG